MRRLGSAGLQSVAVFVIGLLLVALFVAGITIDFASLAALQILGGFALMVVGPPVSIVIASQRRAKQAARSQPPRKCRSRGY